MTASQDRVLRMYARSSEDGDARTANWERFKQIECRHVGYSVIDVCNTADSRFAAYSTWSPHVQLVNVYGEYERHEALDLRPLRSRFCPFSIKFSRDSRELLAGGSDSAMYIYDIERNQRILRVRGHSDDINTVAFADDSCQVILTGSDDTMCKVWDRRMLGELSKRSNPHAHSANLARETQAAAAAARPRSPTGFSSSDEEPEDDTTPSSSPFGRVVSPYTDSHREDNSLHTPVGVLAGHHHGITCIDSKNDGRFFISNSKDQSIKLWDLRAMHGRHEAADSDVDAVTHFVSTIETRRARSSAWDYRWMGFGDRGDAHDAQPAEQRSDDDTSLVTYRGHQVFETLIRCYFSPSHTTGQRYIYSGSSSGDVYIFDVLTGRVVSRLFGHAATVRDMSWHPEEPLLVSGGWDGMVGEWTFKGRRDDDFDASEPPLRQEDEEED